MRKGTTKGNDGLNHPIMTRISNNKYQELYSIASKTKDQTVSSIIRDIIHNTTIKVYTHDETTDLLLEELSSLRSELNAIGVNFNQITKHFNTYPEEDKKMFYAKIGFEKYEQVDSRIKRLVEMISRLCQKWLSE